MSRVLCVVDSFQFDWIVSRRVVLSLFKQLFITHTCGEFASQGFPYDSISCVCVRVHVLIFAKRRKYMAHYLSSLCIQFMYTHIEAVCINGLKRVVYCGYIPVLYTRVHENDYEYV